MSDFTADKPAGLAALSNFTEFKLNLLMLFQGTKTVDLDIRKVNENVRGSVLRRNRPEALLSVEPLHGPVLHRHYLISDEV